MTPDDVRLTAQLVAAGRVHCVSDAATLAMARRVLELEYPTHYGVGQEELQRVKAERDMAQRAAAHWEGVAAANALDVVTEVAAEREACAKLLDEKAVVWRRVHGPYWHDSLLLLAADIRARGAK